MSRHIRLVPDLDPFAFPPETLGRYRMLIAAALVLVWGASALVAPRLVLDEEDLRVDPQAVQKLTEVVEAGGLRNLPAEDLRDLRRVLFGDAGRGAGVFAKWLARIASSLLLVAAALGGAWLLYRWQPWWRSVSRKALPLVAEDAPRPIAELHQLMARAGLSPRIRIAFCAGRRLDGFAFGVPTRETVVLQCPPGSLPALWDEGSMRALAYHEIGHLANGDIRHREVSRALWSIVALLVLAIGGAGAISTAGNAEESASSIAPVLVSNLALLGAVGWIWMGLQRVREFYADWRVVAWGQRAALARLLQLEEARRSARKGLGPVQRLIGSRPRLGRWLENLREHLWYHHPSFRRRRAVLEDGRPLFRVSTELALVSGLLLTLVLAHGQVLFLDLVLFARATATLLAALIGPIGLLAMVAVGLPAMILLAYLVTATLGTQVQRQAIAELATGPREVWGYLRLGSTAAIFALGLEGGLLMTPASSLRASIPVPYFLAWLGGFTLMIWIWLIHLQAMSRLLLGSWTGEQPPRSRQTILTWLSAGLLALVLTPVLAVRITLHKAVDPTAIRSLLGESTTPGDSFVLSFVVTSIVVMAAALAGYLVVGSSSIAVAAWIAWRRTSCPACGHRDSRGLVAGRRCDACGELLTPWLLLRPPTLPAGGA